VPLVSPSASVPGLRSLEVQFAGRHDRYTTDGTLDSVTAGTAVPSARNHISSTDPTVAVRLQPVEDVTFRASYGTGFLPPSVTQLVATPIVSQTAVTDPRRGNEQVLLSGSQVLTGGNAALAPEDSKSWSVGTILTPGFAPGLRAAVDYVSIEKHNVIMNPFIDIQDVVNNELLIPNHVTRAAPAANDPSGVGAIVGIARTLTNVERADVKAIDTALDYRLAQTRFGSFDFDAVATWQTHYKRQLKPGGPTQDLVGISQSNPLKFRMNAALSWERGPWTAGWATRYYDSYRVADPSQTFNATMILNQGHGGRVSSQIYHDAFLGYRFADSAHAGFLHVLTGVHVQLTAKNVFDKSPPFDASDMVRYYSPFGDPRLSSYSLSLRKTF
jgi:outer membrane receptor protein involved in Fe transport